jgi:hypothetical protein
VAPERFVAAARSIMRNMPAYRGVVLSVTRLAANDGKPLVDPRSQPSGTSRRRRLTNPPRHLSSPEIHEIQVPGYGTFRYVWILSNERATFPVGGMLFLPAAGQCDTHLVTFNVGQLDTRYSNRCGNAHHAETQLERWLLEQPPSWRKRLRAVHVANRSRQTTIQGYSPCNACCTDLAALLRSLQRLQPGCTLDAEISWCELYQGNRICGHPTDAANLRRLADSGWRLVGRCPPASGRPRQAGRALQQVPG